MAAGTALTVEEILVRARQAQAGWAARPLEGRLALLGRLRRALAAGAGDLEQALDRQRPRRPGESMTAEILPLADACRFLQREARGLLRPRRLGGWRPLWLLGTTLREHREPRGVVLILAPSNYPLMLPGIQVVQALAAGNAVLVKPAPGMGEPLEILGSLLAGAGLPDQLYRVLPVEVEAGRDVMAAGVDLVVLTGSASTGRAVLADLAPRLTPAVMELSGCDACFVLPGADLELVARALAFGLAFNGSETCIAPRRVFLPPASLEPLLATLLPRVEAIPGRQIPAPVAAGLEPLLAAALESGGKLAAGGLPVAEKRNPWVVADTGPEMGLLQEDIFAPLISLVALPDASAALAADARCPYALGASVFGPEKEARAFAKSVRAGVVTVNDLVVPTADPRLPFGGSGRSGFGRTRGGQGLLEMTWGKVVIHRPGRSRPHLEPPTPGLADLGRALMALGHGGGGIKERLAGWARLVGALRRLGREQRQEKGT